MGTIGDVVRPLFPDHVITDGDSFMVVKASTAVGAPGVRDALRQTPARDWALSDDQFVIVLSPAVPLSGAPVPAIIDDDFTGSTLGAQWAPIGVPTVSGGLLHLPPSAAVTARQTPVVDGMTFTARGIAWASGASGGVRVRSTVKNDNTAFVQFSRSGANLLCYRAPTGAEPYTTSVPFDATAHANLRIRFAAGRVLYQASADGRTWTTVRDAPAPAWAATDEGLFALIASGTGEMTVDGATLA